MDVDVNVRKTAIVKFDTTTTLNDLNNGLERIIAAFDYDEGIMVKTGAVVNEDGRTVMVIEFAS